MPSYGASSAAEMTSGARYAGVPTVDPGAEWWFASLEKPKSQSLASGRGPAPSRSVFSSLMSREQTPCGR